MEINSKKILLIIHQAQFTIKTSVSFRRGGRRVREIILNKILFLIWNAVSKISIWTITTIRYPPTCLVSLREKMQTFSEWWRVYLRQRSGSALLFLLLLVYFSFALDKIDISQRGKKRTRDIVNKLFSELKVICHHHRL